MTSTLISLDAVRKQKQQRRIFLALESLYTDSLSYLADDNGEIRAEDLDAFMVQALGEHLTSENGLPDSPVQSGQVAENYQRFDEHLRNCLRNKLKSLYHFERMSAR